MSGKKLKVNGIEVFHSMDISNAVNLSSFEMKRRCMELKYTLDRSHDIHIIIIHIIFDTVCSFTSKLKIINVYIADIYEHCRLMYQYILWFVTVFWKLIQCLGARNVRYQLMFIPLISKIINEDSSSIQKLLFT